MSELLRIAVISDTHDHVPEGLGGLIGGAHEIWHLGDVCAHGTLLEIECFGPPVFLVRGNNDYVHTWPLTRTLVRGGLRFHLTHIAPRRSPADVEVLLHGHTHVPADEMHQGVRWLNPGALRGPREGSSRGFAWLEIGSECGPDGFRWLRHTL